MMQAYLYWLVRCCIFGSSEAELRTYVLTSNLELVLECSLLVKLLHQQQVTLGQEEYVAFTILPCYINFAFWSCHLEIIFTSSVGGEQVWLPEDLLIVFYYEKLVFMMDLGGDVVKMCTLGLLSERRFLYLFWERNYGLSVS